jgi:ParB family chromosome partitioning protein
VARAWQLKSSARLFAKSKSHLTEPVARGSRAAIARRKAIYEELHPETKAGVAGGLARQGSANEKSAFAESTSDATGKGRRSIEIAAARGEALGDDLTSAFF